jgi:retron-type reverse transcriptase
LGIPTVGDRVAQTVVAKYLEERVEPAFHPDSYGYRPGRSALDAVEVCPKRCWQNDGVIDIDIAAFFDTVGWDHVLAAVGEHTDTGWVLLYVKRWLAAPLQHADGTLIQRHREPRRGHRCHRCWRTCSATTRWICGLPVSTPQWCSSGTPTT